MAPKASGGKAARLLAVLAAAWLVFCLTPAHAASHEIFVQDCFYSNSAGSNNACNPPSTPFGPPLTTVITAGDSVFWQWNSTVDGHTVTSDDGRFGGDCVSATGCNGTHTSPSFQFTLSGNYGYHCDFHGVAGTNRQVGTGMAGLIVVNPGPVATLTFMSGPPSSVQAGTQFSVTLKGVDAFGNLGSGVDRLTFTSTDTAEQKAAQYLQGVWQQTLGINVKLDPLEDKSFQDWFDSRKDQPFNLFLNFWGSDWGDPANWDNQLFDSQSDFYHSHWKNDEFDKTIRDAVSLADKDKRTAMYEQAEKLLNENAAYIPLFHLNRIYVIKPYVKGIVHYPILGRTWLRYISILEHDS